MKTRRVLVCGPYGGYNLGDDAIALAIADQLRADGAEVHLSVIDTERGQSAFPDMPTHVRPRLRQGRLGLLTHLDTFEMILIGGGEQIQEPRLPNPIWGLLATTVHIGWMARRRGIPMCVLGVGVQDKITALGQAMLRSGLRDSKFASVRDIDSKARLERILSREVMLGADPVFLDDRRNVDEARAWLRRFYGIPAESKIVMIVPSNDKTHSMRYVEYFNRLVRQLTTEGVYILYAVTDRQSSYDLEIVSKRLLIENEMTRWLSPEASDWGDVCRGVAACSCLISVRMHPLIAALVNDTPFVCVARNEKMRALMRELTCEDYLEVETVSENQLYDRVKARLVDASMGGNDVRTAVERLKDRARAQYRALAARCLGDSPTS